MPVQGEYLQKYGRKYVAYNPNEFNGPFTWRLSMMPVTTDPGAITTLFTILPIDSTSTTTGTMNLFFNIDGLEDVRSTSTFATGLKAAKGFLNIASRNFLSLYGLNKIQAEAPVQSVQQGTQVALYFDMTSLPALEVPKTGYYVRANDYNSKSIDKITADKPLFVTSSGDENALVNFDISSLDLA